MNSSQIVSTDSKSAEHHFSDESMLRYRLAKAMLLAGNTKSARTYLDLLRLKEELEQFILDIVALDRLALWAKGQKVFIAYLPAFEKLEREHVMVVPLASRMHYIIKIPTAFFDDAELKTLLAGKAQQGMAFNEVDITEVVKAIRIKEPRLFGFARALCALVIGNWELVEQFLKTIPSEPTENNGNTAEKQGLMEQDQFLLYEGYHLRQFALRGAAAKAITQKKMVALKLLNDAGEFLYHMTEEISLDVRYQLTRISWNLETLSTLVEAGETKLDDEQIRQQYPSFCHLKEPEQLVRDCLDIIAKLSQRIMDDDGKIDDNKSRPTQIFYWHYMLGRAYQVIMMVMAATKAGLVPNSVAATYAFKYGRNPLQDHAKEGWECWSTALKKLDELTDPQVTIARIEKKISAANFLFRWYAMQQNKCSVANMGATHSLEELHQARECLNEIMGVFESMENSCRALSHTGYARRVFRRLKAVEYREQREKLGEILFHTMTRLEQEATRSYENW